MPRAVKKTQELAVAMSVVRPKTRKQSLADAKRATLDAPPSFLSEPTFPNHFDTPPVPTVTPAAPSAVQPRHIVIQVRSMFLVSLGYILLAFFMFFAGGLTAQWLITHPEHNPFPQMVQKGQVVVERVAQEGYFSTPPPQTGDKKEEIFAPTERIQYMIQYASTQNLQTAESMLEQLKEREIDAALIESQDEYGQNAYVIRSPIHHSYDEAYRTLAQAPDPYRGWARIDRVTEQEG